MSVKFIGDSAIVNMPKPTFKILCIDGGGIKGLFSACVLSKFEEVYKTNISDHFDLICGTSTGGIIALGISLKIPMKQICDFYIKYGHEIFNESAKKTRRGRIKLWCNQVFGKGKYENDALKKALLEVFEQRTIGESHNLLCIPSYNIITAKPRIFKKDYGTLSEDDNKLYVDVALATAAAPTYFPIKEIEEGRFIDGGIWANNPTLVGLTEYMYKFSKDYGKVDLLSISSLEIPSGEVHSKPLDRSFVHWKSNLFDTFTVGQSFFTDFFMDKLSELPSLKIRYKRIKNDPLSVCQQNVIDMDNANENALKLLQTVGMTTGVKYKDDEDIRRLFQTKKHIIPKIMANNHTQFTAFNDIITLSSSRKETLKGNRKAIRDRITKYFKENHGDDIQPKYHSQGSFAMNTILNPINDSDSTDSLVAFDLDDGVYFISDKNSYDDRLSVTTYHNRVYKAVENHTSLGATDKTTCIRVEYAAGHHIDLPIYFKRKDFKPTLAHKSKDWIDSDPKEFYEWFNAKAKQNQQLRRVVRYLKAWSDYCNSQNTSVKMPSGFILTILASNNFVANDRDDIAMKDVLVKMNNNLKANFSCIRPTTPIGEELLGSNFSETRKNNFMSKLDSFATSAEQAINETNPKKACLKWQKHFGDRFCCSTAKDEDEDVVKQNSAPVINKDGRYA